MSDVIQFPGGQGPPVPPEEPPGPPPDPADPVNALDPVTEAVRVSEENSRLLMSLLAKLIRYQDYCLTMKIDRFTAVLRLAMLDQFSSLDEKAKARKISSPAFLFREHDVQKARSSEEYGRIHADLMAKLEVITSPSFSVDSLAELMEDVNTWELFRIAHFAGAARDRTAALREFTDRRSAKKTRDLGGREMILPERFAEQLVAGMVFLTGKIQEHEEKISGSRLNVPASPKLVGEGRASE
jgi:hypothetical protein